MTTVGEPYKKIAISLPSSLLDRIERLRLGIGETRSGLIRRAVELMLKDIERRARVAGYVEGYRAYPETEEELKAAEATAAELFAEEDWE